jgi:hypothetical protein
MTQRGVAATSRMQAILRPPPPQAPRSSASSTPHCPLLACGDDLLITLLATASGLAAKELAKLQLVSRRITPDLIDEVARLRVAGRRDSALLLGDPAWPSETSPVPRMAQERWLHVLWRLDALARRPAFTYCNRPNELVSIDPACGSWARVRSSSSSGGATLQVHPAAAAAAAAAGGEVGPVCTTVVCEGGPGAPAVMVGGVHRARFHVLHVTHSWLTVGIAPARVGGGWIGRGGGHGCELGWASDGDGFGWHAGFGGSVRHRKSASGWVGQEGYTAADELELCLDLRPDEGPHGGGGGGGGGTLTAFKCGRRLGVLARDLLRLRGGQGQGAGGGRDQGWCWMAEMIDHRDGVRIRAAAPVAARA